MVISVYRLLHFLVEAYMPPAATEIMRSSLDSLEIPYEFAYRDEHGLDIDVFVDMREHGRKYAFQLRGTPSRPSLQNWYKDDLLRRLGYRVRRIDLSKINENELATNPDHQLKYKLRMASIFRNAVRPVVDRTLRKHNLFDETRPRKLPERIDE